MLFRSGDGRRLHQTVEDRSPKRLALSHARRSVQEFDACCVMTNSAGQSSCEPARSVKEMTEVN